MRFRTGLFIASFSLCSAFAVAQALDPAQILKPLSDSWLTYSGDYSGKRFSTLTQINQSNVKNLTLAWLSRMNAGPGNIGTLQTIIGGEGAGEFAGVTLKGAILQVNGILYVSAPDNAWAVDARDGHVMWHYFWRTRGGTHIGNRGLGMWRDRLFMETPDNYLVSLDSKTGKELWHVTIADFELQYFSTMAPIVVGDHVLVGTGNDLDEPGMLQSFDPETGKRQWVWYPVPMKQGDPGLETWKSLDAARHGGGQIWVPGAYDPETHLYITGTGNPSPAYTSISRGDGENLFTCSIVAINVDTGKMAWYYQTSPHDTHDWDTAQTPILIDAQFNGRLRKLVLHASRNGYYFTLDRTTGERLISTRYSETANWATGLNKHGQPIRDPEKDFHIGGSLVSPNNTGVTNWPPPSFSPDSGLFYVPRYDSYAMYYLTETDPRGAMGLGGKEEVNVGSLGSHLVAIDYKTGKTVWDHRYPSNTGGTLSGVLTTAGRLLFTGDNAGNLIAFDPANGNPLWHSRIGQVSNAPETYMLDGHQYLLSAVGDTLFAFTLY
jgi:alcohol dehydrogenase (cytochrome c)